MVLPGRPAALDSVRAILSRDLDYSDRFEVITLPTGDSLRVGAVALGTTPARGAPGRPRSGGAQAAGPNYPLYLALGADFVVDLRAAGDTTVVDVHDVAAGALRRTFQARLPAPNAAGFRMAVHRLADQVLQAALGGHCIYQFFSGETPAVERLADRLAKHVQLLRRDVEVALPARPFPRTSGRDDRR